MWIKTGLYLFFTASAGGAIAAGYVAFITLLGIFERLSEKYKASKYYREIENCVIVGVSLGNLLSLLNVILPFGLAGLFIFNFIGGVFIGCLAGALAETLKVFPILSRRFSIRKGLPYILIAAALGKALGSAIQLIYF